MPANALTHYRRGMTEAEMLSHFAGLALGGGGFMKHIRDARRQNVEGLPDVILAVPPVLALFELKTRRDELRAEQIHVLDVLSRCTVIVSGKVRPVPKREGELSMDEARERIMVWRPDLEVY